MDACLGLLPFQRCSGDVQDVLADFPISAIVRFLIMIAGCGVKTSIPKTCSQVRETTSKVTAASERDNQ